MGYYIEVPANHGKAQLIADGKALVNVDGEWRQAPDYKAEIIARPASLAEIPGDKALICIVSNGLFEAAGYCFDQREFDAFAVPDARPRIWVLMDKDAAELCSGYRSRS